MGRLRQGGREEAVIIFTRMSLHLNLNEDSSNNRDSLLQEKKMQLKSWQEKCELQNKKIKLFKKENEEIKHSLTRQTQIDTALLLNSKELSDNNAKLQAAIDQMMKKIEDNIDSVGNASLSKAPPMPELITIQSTTVTQQTEQLDLPSQGISDDDIIQLKGFKHINSLLLGENKIGNVGVSTITTHLTAVTKLHLNSNCFNAQALSGIGNLHNLKVLDIRGNNLGDSCMVFLTVLTTLQQLSISKNAITDIGIKQLYGLNSLVYLDFTTNLVTDQGVRSLLQLKKLTHLYMMSNRLTESSVFMIYASLPLVVVLDVRFNVNDANKKEEMRAKKPVTMQLFC